MWGPFVGGHVAGSDRWWKPVIYWLLKNVLLILSVHCSYKQWSEWLQVRDYPGHPPSLINGNFTYPVHLCTRGGGKKKKKKNIYKGYKSDRRSDKSLTRKKAPKVTGALAGLQAGFNPPTGGLRRRDPCPAGQVQRPRARAALPRRPFPTGSAGSSPRRRGERGPGRRGEGRQQGVNCGGSRPGSSARRSPVGPAASAPRPAVSTTIGHRHMPAGRPRCAGWTRARRGPFRGAA